MTIEEFFRENEEIAVAFSGGVDSAYLLYIAQRYAKRVTAYYVKTRFQPQFELCDAERFADEIGAELKIINLDILKHGEITDNPENRCYYCKKQIFTAICQAAHKDGYKVIVDGTNASDDLGDRPGMKALKELSVLSPLRIWGMTKEEIREKSKEAGLFTWNKPAYACLATRIPTGVKITKEKLSRTEKAEDFLFSLGFSDFRVREFFDCAKLQFKEEEFSLFIKHKNEINTLLKKYYSGVLLDTEGR